MADVTEKSIVDLTLEDTKLYLRVDHEDDDDLLNLMIPAAKSFIQSYLNRKFSVFLEEDGNIPQEFTIAFFAIVSHWYERRSILGDKETGKQLPYVFSGILDMYRVWNK